MNTNAILINLSQLNNNKISSFKPIKDWNLIKN